MTFRVRAVLMVVVLWWWDRSGVCPRCGRTWV